MKGTTRQLVHEGSCGFPRFLDKVRLRRIRSFLRNFLTSPRVASSPLLTASSLARAAVVALILLAGQTEESSEVKNLLTLFRYVHLKARFFPFRVGSWLDLETSRTEPSHWRRRACTSPSAARPHRQSSPPPPPLPPVPPPAPRHPPPALESSSPNQLACRGRRAHGHARDRQRQRGQQAIGCRTPGGRLRTWHTERRVGEAIGGGEGCDSRCAVLEGGGGGKLQRVQDKCRDEHAILLYGISTNT
jgi:hypothetical protein